MAAKRLEMPSGTVQSMFARRNLLADMSAAPSKESSPSPLRVKSKRPNTVLLSDSEDDQRVPDTVEKAAPRSEAVDTTSDCEALSLEGHSGISARLAQGGSQSGNAGNWYQLVDEQDMQSGSCPCTPDAGRPLACRRAVQVV